MSERETGTNWQSGVVALHCVHFLQFSWESFDSWSEFNYKHFRWKLAQKKNKIEKEKEHIAKATNSDTREEQMNEEPDR